MQFKLRLLDAILAKVGLAVELTVTAPYGTCPVNALLIGNGIDTAVTVAPAFVYVVYVETVHTLPCTAK